MTNVQGAKILVVDDEQNIRDIVKAYLAKEGYVVHTAVDGPSALKAARQVRPDLVVLDIMLPEMDGMEVLQHLRRESDVYVLMLTAKAEETDKVVGLSVGADDYLTKPFSPRELVARVKAILCRGRTSTVAAQEQVLAFRHVRIDPAARQVWKNDQPVELTSLEFDLLATLLLTTVSDTGIGIPAEHLPHIFERFYRVDKSRSRAGGGSGIGLTIAQHLVELQGGRIWAESAGPGRGSTFYFTLPVAPDHC